MKNKIKYEIKEVIEKLWDSEKESYKENKYYQIEQTQRSVKTIRSAIVLFLGVFFITFATLMLTNPNVESWDDNSIVALQNIYVIESIIVAFTLGGVAVLLAFLVFVDQVLLYESFKTKAGAQRYIEGLEE